MTFELTGWMEYAMWAVLGVMGLHLLVELLKNFKDTYSLQSVILGFLSDLLYCVFPLFLIVNMMGIDPTGWVLMVVYYVGAAGVFLKYLYELKSKM